MIETLLINQYFHILFRISLHLKVRCMWYNRAMRCRPYGMPLLAVDDVICTHPRRS